MVVLGIQILHPDAMHEYVLLHQLDFVSGSSFASGLEVAGMM